MTVTMQNKLIATAIVLSLFLATYAQVNNVGSQKAYAQGGRGAIIKFDLKQLQQLAKTVANVPQQVKVVIMQEVRNQKGGR
jgi:hypothetical protein